MEAKLFGDICEAIQKQQNRLKFNIQNESPILKIVWSSFTYLGPELKFVWEPEYADPDHEQCRNKYGWRGISPFGNLQNLEEGSTNSSMSKNTDSETTTARDQYEDIEPITSNELVGDFHFPSDDVLLTVTKESIFGSNEELPRCSDDLPSGSYDGAVTNSTFTFCDSQETPHSISPPRNENLEENFKTNSSDLCQRKSSEQRLSSRSRSSSRSFITTTPSESTERSTMALAEEDDNARCLPTTSSKIDSPRNSIADAKTVLFSPPPALVGYSSVSAPTTPLKTQKKGTAATPMVTSCVDSGIANTASMESQLSTFSVGMIASPSPSDQPPEYHAPSHSRGHSVVRYNAIDDRCSIQCVPNSNKIKADSSSRALIDDTALSENFAAFTTEDDEESADFHKFMELEQQQNPSYSNRRLTDSRFTIQSSVLSSSSFMFDSPKKDLIGLTSDERDLTTFTNDSKIFSEILTNNFLTGEQLFSTNDDIDNSKNEADQKPVFSDEEFVTKNVIAEQISCVQLSTQLTHKFQSVPSRGIDVGTFIFSSLFFDEDQQTKMSPSISAFSIILASGRSGWYLDRVPVFTEIIIDIVSQFKASAIADNSTVDIISLLTQSFSTLFEYFGALERWPLTNSFQLTSVKIQSTYLWDVKKPGPSELAFLCRSITACLISRGHCTVVGANPKEVQKLLLTLSLFLRSDERRLCLLPYSLPFSPYLRLQAIKRTDLDSFYTEACASHWPVSLIDLDRRTVTHSGPYTKHRALKLAYCKHQMWQQASNYLESNNLNLHREPFLAMHSVPVDQTVFEMLENLFLLPQSRMARYAYLDHFQLRLDNQAAAFTYFVRKMSFCPTTEKIHGSDDKRNPVAMRWSLSAARRFLGLLSDTAFGICLARADAITPELAEFIAQSSLSSLQHGSNCY